MYRLLAEMRVIEAAAFVAAPLCGLHLAQFGAEVIRIDTIGGGPDFGRWPKAPNGSSLYWEGLNKGKKSVAIDLSSPRGRELAVGLATAAGDNAGIVVTNFPAGGFLSHDSLARRRSDMITVRIMGWADGTSAVDYTVNAAFGLPMMTGPEELGQEPVNHALPAWDIAAGNYAAFALLAAERRRRLTGLGGEIRVPLGDIAMSTMSALGQVAEVSMSGKDRPRLGNDIFGAFGRDFVTRDGRRVMVVGLTRRHWRDLVKCLEIEAAIDALEVELGVDLAADEGIRFEKRDRLNPIVAKAISRRNLAELKSVFEGTGVCWGEYQGLCQALGEDASASSAQHILSTVRQAGGYAYPSAGAPGSIATVEREAAAPAPQLGEHTAEVLASLLNLPDAEIASLHDDGVVASARPGSD
jgi:2-methylfumaryl-CoA isomerase